MGAYKLKWSSAYHLDHESDLHSNEHLLINGKNRVFSLLAQLVEHCTYIAEVMGSNPVWAWSFFFRPYFYHYLSSTHYCKDCFHIYFFICSSDDFCIFTVRKGNSLKLLNVWKLLIQQYLHIKQGVFTSIFVCLTWKVIWEVEHLDHQQNFPPLILRWCWLPQNLFVWFCLGCCLQSYWSPYHC